MQASTSNSHTKNEAAMAGSPTPASVAIFAARQKGYLQRRSPVLAGGNLPAPGRYHSAAAGQAKIKNTGLCLSHDVTRLQTPPLCADARSADRRSQPVEGATLGRG